MAQRKQRYRGAHDRERRRWALQVEQGLVTCARCGGLIEAGALWDLDHAPDGQSYLGPSHRRCNRRTAAHRAARRAALSGERTTRLNLDENGIFEDPIGTYWRVEPGNPKSRPQRVSRRW
jgi:hypothetical protein